MEFPNLITEQERQEATAKLKRIVTRGAQKWRKNEPPEYSLWCYCSYCPLSEQLIPHYRRDDICPQPCEYVHNWRKKSMF